MNFLVWFQLLFILWAEIIALTVVCEKWKLIFSLDLLWILGDVIRRHIQVIWMISDDQPIPWIILVVVSWGSGDGFRDYLVCCGQISPPRRHPLCWESWGWYCHTGLHLELDQHRLEGEVWFQPWSPWEGELCILCVFQYYCTFVFQFAEDVSFADFLIATKDQEKVIFVIVQF